MDDDNDDNAMRQKNANYEARMEGNWCLLLFGREGRWCRPRGDRAIKHDPADARIDSRRKLSGLHPF